MFITTIFIVLSAFGKGEDTPQDTPLFGTRWTLTKIHTDSATEEVTGGKAFIKFNEEKKSAGGNGSCNSFGSTLTVNKDSISIKNIFSTRMYCEGVQKTENSFLSQLEKVSRFEIKGNLLILFYGKEILLEFKKDTITTSYLKSKNM